MCTNRLRMQNVLFSPWAHRLTWGTGHLERWNHLLTIQLGKLVSSMFSQCFLNPYSSRGKHINDKFER